MLQQYLASKDSQVLLQQRNLAASNEQSDERMRLNQSINNGLSSHFPTAALQGSHLPDQLQRSTFEHEPRLEG